MTQVYVVFKKDFEDISEAHGTLVTIFKNKYDAEHYVAQFNANSNNAEKAFFRIIEVQ